MQKKIEQFSDKCAKHMKIVVGFSENENCKNSSKPEVEKL